MLSPPLSWVFYLLHEHLMPGNSFVYMLIFGLPQVEFECEFFGEQGLFCSLSLDPTPEQCLDPAVTQCSSLTHTYVQSFNSHTL